MLRSVIGAVTFALCSVSLLAPSFGQSTGSPRRPPGISQRLERFRNELLGESTPRKYPTNERTSERSPTPARTDRPRVIPSPQSPTEAKPTEAKPTLAEPENSRMVDISDASKEAEPTLTSSRRASPPLQAAKEPAIKEPATAKEPTVAKEPIFTAKRETPAIRSALSTSGKSSPTLAEEKPTPAVKRPANDTPRVARLERPAATPAASGVAEELAEHSIKRVTRDNLLFSGQSPMLSVEASGPRKVLIGKEAVFVVNIRNSGEVAANNVTVTINVPSFAEVSGTQPSSGSTRPPGSGDQPEPLEWKISRLEAHGRETLTLRLVPHKSLPIDLSVQWACAPEITQTLVEVQEPKLIMALAGPEEVLFGQSKIYKLTLSNPGNGDAENVVVNLLPLGRAGDKVTSHKLGTVRAGDSKAIEVELTARQAGVLTIKAQAYADGGLRSEAAEQVLVRRAGIRVEVEGPKVKYAGTLGTFRVRVTNSGNATAEGVQVAAMLPPQAKYVTSNAGGRMEPDQGKVSWNVGTLQAGGERQFEMQCHLFAPGENRMQAIASANDDLSDAATASTRVEAIADLKLEVRDPQGPIAVGEDTVYDVVVRNRGTKSAEGIDLTVYFSEGLEATSVQGGAHEISGGQVAFKTLASLPAGGEISFRIHARSDRAGNHVFRAEVVCQSLHTKLAAEETTHFYGEEAADARPAQIETHASSLMDAGPMENAP